MAISNELSGEIAAALLAAKQRTPGELSNLRETVLKVHSILQQLAAESRRRNLLYLGGHEPSDSASKASL